MYREYSKQQLYCAICYEKIKNFSFLEHFILNYNICKNCYHQMDSKLYIFQYENIKIYSQYVYKGFFRQVYLRFKEGGDIILSGNLLSKFWYFYFWSYTCVLVPSHIDKINERGFYHLPLIFHGFDHIYADVLIKRTNYEQALQKITYRDSISNQLDLLNIDAIRGKKVLLCDDVMTSGRTIYHCVNLLKPYAREIKVLVLSHAESLRRKKRKRLHLKKNYCFSII